MTGSLTMRQFVIQSDFITQASREDVFDSPWNRALRKGVADAFCDAVEQFCRHPQLQFTWMRFLPDESIADSFWSTLRTDIIERLKLKAVIRSRSGLLHKAKNLRILPTNTMDSDGVPLFRDIRPFLYLAAEYSQADQDRLKTLGLGVIFIEELLTRFQADLASPNSVYKSPSTSTAWHIRVVDLLCGWLDVPQVTSQILDLAMIPLRGGVLLPSSWVSASSGTIYFPDCEGETVPPCVDLRVLDPSVVDSGRSRLWRKMGIVHVTPSLGVQKVIAAYQVRSLSLDESISLLRFLFWHLSDRTASLSPSVSVVDAQWMAQRVVRNDGPHLYSPRSSYSHSANALLPDPAPLLRSWKFLHVRYLDQYGIFTMRHGWTWATFLEKAVMVSDYPRLLKKGSITLSDEIGHIIEKESEQLVGTLLKHRVAYLAELRHVKTDLKQALVPCILGSRQKLMDTVFPLLAIKDHFRTIGLSNFPFLQVPVEMTNLDVPELAILVQLGVSASQGLALLQKALGFIRRSEFLGTVIPECLVNVYGELHVHAAGDVARKALRYAIIPLF